MYIFVILFKLINRYFTPHEENLTYTAGEGKLHMGFQVDITFPVQSTTFTTKD
jgi:hypothetical protein